MSDVLTIVDHKGDVIVKPLTPFPWLAILLIGIGFCLIGQQLWLLFKPKTSDKIAATSANGQVFYTITGGSLDYNDSPPVSLVEPAFVKALDVAILRWQEALPSRKIKRPFLMQTKERSGGPTIAFVNLREYEIIVVTDKMKGIGFDWPSIMMHEVGHLLGVPHIQGDTLMDATYTEAVYKPTRFAVALALANKGE